MCLIAANTAETVKYLSNTVQSTALILWLSKKNFHCWHAELLTETTTGLVKFDSVHNRSLNALFYFLMILTSFGVHN